MFTVGEDVGWMDAIHICMTPFPTPVEDDEDGRPLSDRERDMALRGSIAHCGRRRREFRAVKDAVADRLAGSPVVGLVDRSADRWRTPHAGAFVG